MKLSSHQKAEHNHFVASSVQEYLNEYLTTKGYSTHHSFNAMQRYHTTLLETKNASLAFAAADQTMRHSMLSQTYFSFFLFFLYLSIRTITTPPDINPSDKLHSYEIKYGAPTFFKNRRRRRNKNKY